MQRRRAVAFFFDHFDGVRLLFLSLAAGISLYGGVLALPFYHDDVVILRALSRQSLAEIWWASPLLPYYRPLSYFPWKLMQVISGRADPTIVHALVLAGHLLNIFLVGWLARCVAPPPRRRLAGLTAALLFAVFPFSYQSVTWAASITHTATAAGALGAALAGLYWRRNRIGSAIKGRQPARTNCARPLQERRRPITPLQLTTC